ncbi:hypothetical protein C4Z15_009160 [Enterobacter hormaechei subsp. xiangfangensis]|uniref:hypothetical protein n=1 Tax=Enterobacter hormaechei TaxID=158836 RepID=UPI000CEBFCF7|nr:hypothetical protein [Enterobacter hormaechei]ROD31912.1 hypothetical protein C4Z15_009160 [Enterobacter hormaechei subsp. xiangfangensis]
MTANKPMTGEQLDELMTIAVNMQRDSEKVSERPAAMFAYAVQVAVLELRKVRNEAAALAAELRAVEAIHNEAVFITDDRYEQCPPEVQKIIRSLAVMQIPAYHAFLAEVRASAVDEACLKISNAIVNCYQDEQVGLYAAATICGDFAAQLRKGVQS